MFASIDQSIVRGDADIGLSGVEDTPTRRAALSLTIPYYRFREVLSVRTADLPRFRTLADLRGHKVGTLSGTIAYEILLRAEQNIRPRGGVVRRRRASLYSDLVLGRVDAVLLDHVLAERRMRTLPGFAVQPGAVAIGHYVGALAPDQAGLRDRVQRHPARGDAGRISRTHLPEVARLERRPAHAVCADAGR